MLSQLFLHGRSRVADFFDGSFQLLRRHTELLRPISNFIVFARIDAATVLRASVLPVVAHSSLHHCLAPTVSAIFAPRAPKGFGLPVVVSRAVWCSVSAFSS